MSERTALIIMANRCVCTVRENEAILHQRGKIVHSRHFVDLHQLTGAGFWQVLPRTRDGRDERTPRGQSQPTSGEWEYAWRAAFLASVTSFPPALAAGGGLPRIGCEVRKVSDEPAEGVAWRPWIHS